MANLLNIAGGIGKGYVEGDQDNQRRAEFNYMQNQRQRQIKQQALDDALTEQLKSVRPAGSYDDYDSSPDAGEEGPPSVAKKTGTKTTITAADADRARANIMARSGRLQDIQAAGTLRQNAYQSEAADRATRQAQAQEVLGNAGQQLAAGDHVGAIRTMQQGLVNSQHPDGHQIVIENRDGVPHVGVAGPDGRYTQQPVPATPEAAKAMLNQGYAMLNSDAHFKAQELGIHQQTANATTAQAAAAQQRAATEASKVYYDTLGAGGTADLAVKKANAAYLSAHANYMNNRASAESADQYGTPIPIVNTGTGESAYMTPVRKGINGIPGEAQITKAPAGYAFMKQPQQMTDLQKDRMKRLDTLDEEGFFKDKNSGKVNQALRNQWIESNHLSGLTGSSADPIAVAANKAGDPDAGKKGDKTTPVVPAAPQKSRVQQFAEEAQKSRARDAIAQSQDQLREQFASGKASPEQFAKDWAALEQQKQAIQ